MAYAIPEFPLTIAIYDDSAGAPAAMAREITKCNLSYGKRSLMQFWNWADSGSPSIYAWILLPPRTDIRDIYCVEGADWVELPVSSGRWYRVQFVDDYGLGFANEHRFAVLEKIGQWPTPIPGAYGVFPPPAA